MSIAFGAGTDAAVEAGDIVLVWRDPRDVPRAFSRVGHRAPAAVGAALMSLSTVIVAVNAQLLSRTRS